MNNVRNPVRTLKIAGPLGLGICALLYILANIAYFSAASEVRRTVFLSRAAVLRVSVPVTDPDQVFWGDCGCSIFQ